jgi:acetolactate synthase-1/3 small subunit
MIQTFSILVENQPGVLTRVAGLFGRRGFNIQSLAVGVTQDPTLSRMTVVVDGDDRVLEQVKKQLDKLVNVLKVSVLEGPEAISRELALVRVYAPPSQRAAIQQLADIFRARIVDVARRSLVVEVTGDQDKVAAMMSLLAEFGIIEVVRTGRIAMARGGRQVGGKAMCNAQSKGGTHDGEGLLRRGRGSRAPAGVQGGCLGVREPRERAGAKPEG